MLVRFSFSLLLFSLVSSLTAGSIFDRLQAAAGDLALPLQLIVEMDSLQASTFGKQPATVIFNDEEGTTQEWALKVAIRGKFRRHRCAQVPLKLDFKKGGLRAAGLTEFDEYKLVVPCTHHRAAETRLLKEYLAYKAYQIFTPSSFRVQLLDLTLKDAAGKKEDQNMLAFLIEDIDELAAREQAIALKNGLGQSAGAFLPAAEATHALFQYIIGNTDWSSTLAMNTKILQRADGKLLPVGYDFDFSAWVDAPYALPRREVGQDFLAQRVYLGFVQSDAVLLEVTGLFLARKEALLALIETSPLTGVHRRSLTKEVKSIYQDIQHYREHDMAMLYGQLRGKQASVIPIGGMIKDFGLME